MRIKKCGWVEIILRAAEIKKLGQALWSRSACLQGVPVCCHACAAVKGEKQRDECGFGRGGVVWHSVVWHGVAWRGVVWRDVM